MRHCMQEMEGRQSSDSNHGVPSQYTHPEIIFARGHASWQKRKNFVGAKKNNCVCIYSWGLLMGVQFSLRTINKILFRTHRLTCKCHPIRLSVITIIESCTSTPTPKLILRLSTQAGRKKNNGWRYEKYIAWFFAHKGFKNFSSSFVK